MTRIRHRHGNKPGQISDRERLILAALVQMHAQLSQDHGLSTQFTAAAVEHVVGSACAGSLAGLTMLGYIRQRVDPAGQGIVYSVTETGYAKHAGIEGLI